MTLYYHRRQQNYSSYLFCVPLFLLVQKMPLTLYGDTWVWSVGSIYHLSDCYFTYTEGGLGTTNELPQKLPEMPPVLRFQSLGSGWFSFQPVSLHRSVALCWALLALRLIETC